RARVGERQDRFGAVGADDPPPAARDRVDRLAPGDRRELPGALGPHAPKRREHAERRMHALRVLAHLAADHALREGVVRVAGDACEAAVLDADEEATAGWAVVRTDGQHPALKGIMALAMFGWLVRLNPFKTPDTQRLAVLFGVVYFAQGMWYLPNQAITIVLKDRGLAAGQVADFFLISTIPWLIKPVYGLLSDFVPLFGRRRKSYFLLTSGLASLTGFALALSAEPSYWRLALLYTAMGLGLAFTDVLTDAVMV